MCDRLAVYDVSKHRRATFHGSERNCVGKAGADVATVWRCMMSLSTGGRRFMAASVTVLKRLEPMSRGRTDSRKRKPKQLAIINELCTGCAGSPVCVGYCPVEQCMFWVPDDDHPPFGRVEVDKSTCIGCAKCTAKGDRKS